jgi:two-component system response regulator RegA
MTKLIEREVPRIIVAEDDRRLSEVLAAELRERQYEPIRISSIQEFRDLKLDGLEFALIDLRLGADSGLELIVLMKTRFPNCRIVVLTGYGSIPTAVEAIRRGAHQYLTKPAKIDDIEKALWDESDDGERLEARPTTLAQAERDFIDSVLLQCEGNISQAAKRLGIHRQSLQRKMKKQF